MLQCLVLLSPFAGSLNTQFLYPVLQILFVGCLDTLAMAHYLNMSVVEEEREKLNVSTVFTKDDYSVVNRFESMLH